MDNLSRRDFLRRAGKEAAETGAKIVPGGQLAKKFIEDGQEKPGDFVEPQTKKWWERFVLRNTNPNR